jgi:predicted nuclease of predicted toxin-antitoxin system
MRFSSQLTSWSFQLNTKLRLLIDESIEDPLADFACGISAFNAACVRDLQDLRGKSDRDVMIRAQAEDRIVLTLDAGFNKSNYPICRHEGIIRIGSACKRVSMMADSIGKFSLCGHRSAAKHSITVITKEKCMFETIDKVFSYRFK